MIGEQGERAYWTPADDPILDAAARASEAVFGKPATRYVSMPGTAPMWQVCGRDRVPATTLGGGTWDCHAHAPDENVRLDYAADAARVTARFLDAFAALAGSGPERRSRSGTDARRSGPARAAGRPGRRDGSRERRCTRSR